MNWVFETSSFKYNGKPVNRQKYKLTTPLGDFKVYEAVSGNAMMEYIYLGLDGDRKTQIKYGKLPCYTLENGLEICENKWKDILLQINNIK